MVYIHNCTDNKMSKDEFIDLYNKASDDTKALIECLLTDGQLLP